MLLDLIFKSTWCKAVLTIPLNFPRGISSRLYETITYITYMVLRLLLYECALGKSQNYARLHIPITHAISDINFYAIPFKLLIQSEVESSQEVKSFCSVSPWNLRVHERILTWEKPFNCHHCDKKWIGHTIQKMKKSLTWMKVLLSHI